MKISFEQARKIQILKEKLKLDQKTFEEILQYWFKRTNTAFLSYSEAEKLIQMFEHRYKRNFLSNILNLFKDLLKAV